MPNIKHIQQPTGNSCGPTCLKMIHEALHGWKDSAITEYVPPNIEMICEMCGTDWIVGTPPDRMEKGMKQLNIKYVEYIGSPRPYELLDSVIESGNIGLLRTITQGVPHWILVTESYLYGDSFNIIDPWLGNLEYNVKQLEKIWKPRDYQFFEIRMNGN